MPKVTAAEFSRLAGVSKPAITKAVAAGRLVVANGKLDTDNPKNAIYLSSQHGARPAPKPKAGPKKMAAPADSTKRQAKKSKAADHTEDEPLDLDADDVAAREKIKATIADLMGENSDLDLEKKRADIALKKSMERRHTFKLAQDKKTVVLREDVRRALAMMSASIESNVLKIPMRIVPKLFAMAKAGASSQEGILELERDLSAAVARMVEETTDAV